MRTHLRTEYGFGVRSYLYDDLLLFDSEDVRTAKGPGWLKEQLTKAIQDLGTTPATSEEAPPHRYCWKA